MLTFSFQTSVSLEDGLMFAAAALPPAEMTSPPSIEFLTDSPFLMVSMCTNTPKLPLMDSYKTNMECGIQSDPGFGCFQMSKAILCIKVILFTRVKACIHLNLCSQLLKDFTYKCYKSSGLILALFYFILFIYFLFFFSTTFQSE